MITTRNEVKEFLQITGDAQDGLIDRLIPSAQSFLFEEIRNYFKDSRVFVEGTTIAFVDSDPDTITDSGSNFVTNKFTGDNFYVVEGSLDNAGIIHVKTVAAGTLTLFNNESVVAEAAGEFTRITKMKIPADIPYILAEIVGQFLKVNPDASSEKIGEYSITYDFRRRGGVPQAIMDKLNRYRRIKT